MKLNRIKIIVLGFSLILFSLPLVSSVLALDIVDCTNGPWDTPDGVYISQYADANFPGDPDRIAKSIEEYNKQCKPNSLKDLQPLVVRIIYVVWLASGSVFVIGFMYIGYMYMTSFDDVNKQVEMRQKSIYLVIGIILLFASQPFATVLMKTVITSSNDCFDGIGDTPGFTFFFDDVCTSDSAILAIDDGIGGCCVPGEALNDAKGCFGAGLIRNTAGRIQTVSSESCSVSNAACESGNSCTVSSSSFPFGENLDFSYYEGTGAPRPDHLGRTIIINVNGIPLNYEVINTGLKVK